MTTELSAPRAYLVGAGPGHPGLLTLRAIECLRRANLVLYDRLIPRTLLDFAPERAEKICVADLAPHHTERTSPILERMLTAAHSGQVVVRLKGGDPSIFGRGGEEAEALAEAGIPFEIVPGVSAALGASAYAGIPLTHRRHASAVAFVTGHENPDKPESMLDWHSLAHFPGTLVFYMGMYRLDHIARTLIAQGKPESTPAAVVHHATMGDQLTITATLAEVASMTQTAGIGAPALVIVGDVVRLRDRLDWFGKLPLLGRRVIVTRPREQARDMMHRLVELGAIPFLLPTVEIRELDDWTHVDQAIQSLPNFHWLVFTSVNGVRAFMHRLRLLGRDLRALGHLRFATIGNKTAQALRQFHLDPDVVPEQFQSEHLAEALITSIASHERVLLARADRGRDLLRDELSKHCEVEQVAVYSQVDSVDMDEAVVQSLRRGEIDFVTASSSNIARSLLHRLDDACRIRLQRGDSQLISISPVTSAAIRELGFEPAAESRQATQEGMIEAMVELAAQRRSRQASKAM